MRRLLRINRIWRDCQAGRREDQGYLKVPKEETKRSFLATMRKISTTQKARKDPP
jgi:hypothetical protein